MKPQFKIIIISPASPLSSIGDPELSGQVGGVRLDGSN
jgi:hypothetical protein